jgi:hypothetical protein
MFATTYLAKARNSFAKLENVVPHRSHTTLAVTVTAAAVALVPTGAAFAATSVGAPAAAAHSSVQAAAQPKAAAAAPAAAPAKQQAAAAPAAAPVPAAPPVSDSFKTTTISGLEPTGLYGYQETFHATAEQWANARTITDVAKNRGMTPYAAVIAVATAIQESTLKNINYGDRDSLGLFQQRPSCGWGTASEITTPSYAADKFLSVLQSKVPDYQNESLWNAAQTVQQSGFPTAYAKWETEAAQMVHDIAA